MHTAEETLSKAKETRPEAVSVSPTHPGEDAEWWISDAEGDVFAVATWTGVELSIRDYIP